MDKLPKNQEAMLYPLGKDVLAAVKTRAGEVKIHIRHYKAPTNTKGERVRPTQRGMILNLKQFLRLLKAQNRLMADFNKRMSDLLAFVAAKEGTNHQSPEKEEERRLAG
ncbi:hypothetical protein ACOMHN_012583 [Nucella lapillus]